MASLIPLAESRFALLLPFFCRDPPAARQIGPQTQRRVDESPRDAPPTQKECQDSVRESLKPASLSGTETPHRTRSAQADHDQRDTVFVKNQRSPATASGRGRLSCPESRMVSHPAGLFEGSTVSCSLSTLIVAKTTRYGGGRTPASKKISVSDASEKRRNACRLFSSKRR